MFANLSEIRSVDSETSSYLKLKNTRLAESMYYKWSKEFLEAGKKRLSGSTARATSTDEVKGLRREARDLKECVADLTLENRLLKKA